MKIEEMVHDRLSCGRPSKATREAWKRMAGNALAVPCQKNRKPNKGACCCNCAFHYRDHSHPVTDGKGCTHTRGWICGAPELGFSSGWGKHGLCECHTTRRELRRAEDVAAVGTVLRSLPPRLRAMVETSAWYAYEQKCRKEAK